jgi:hypothetical protein
MLPINTLGSVVENTLSTDNGLLPVSQLAGDLYYNLGVNLQFDLSKYGEKGSYAEWEVEQGKSYKLTLVSDNCELVFLFNGEETKQLRIYEGINELTFTAPESKFGLILLNNYGSKTVSYLELKELSQLAIDTQPLTLYTVGTGAKGSLLTNTYSLSTSGTKTVGSLGKVLGIDLTNYGTEGSAVILSGLLNGVYSASIKLENTDSVNPDSLYVYNGKNITKLADINGVIVNSFDIIYGYIALIAMDVSDKKGTTIFNISNIEKVGELNYEVPVQIKLIPDNSLGDVDIYSTETRIVTGTSSRSLKTISDSLEIDVNDLGNEGSFATWNVENGTYSLEYYLRTSESNPDNDKIYQLDDLTSVLLAERSEADLQSGTSLFISETKTKQVRVNNGKLTILAVDTGVNTDPITGEQTVNKTGTTAICITKIERISTSQEIEEELGENPVKSTWLDETPITINKGDKLLIKFSSSVEQLAEFSITPNSDLSVKLLDSLGNIVYEPISNLNVFINTYTWQLGVEQYVIEIESTDNIELNYSLFSESTTGFSYSTGFKSDNVGNNHHIGVIHPIWGYEYGWYQEKYPDGLSITEIINDEGSLYDEIDGYESSKTIKFAVDPEEAGIYEIAFYLADLANFTAKLYYNGQLIYEPLIDGNKQERYQHFTWELLTGNYELHLTDKSSYIGNEYYPWFELQFHKGGNPNNIGNESHQPEWNFKDNRSIVDDVSDFNLLPHSPVDYMTDEFVGIGTGLDGSYLSYESEGYLDFSTSLNKRQLMLCSYPDCEPVNYRIINTNNQLIAEGIISSDGIKDGVEEYWITSGNYRLIYSFVNPNSNKRLFTSLNVATDINTTDSNLGIINQNDTVTRSNSANNYDYWSIYSFELSVLSNLALSLNCSNFDTVQLVIKNLLGEVIKESNEQTLLVEDLESGNYLLGVYIKPYGDITYLLTLNCFSNNPYEPILSSPPLPIPDTGKLLGDTPENSFNLGEFTPDNTGDPSQAQDKVWNRGYVYNSAQNGVSQIQSFIGGDDLSQWIKFTLNSPLMITVEHNNVITELVNSNNGVIVNSSGNYEGIFQAQLEPGNYFVHFSSESSIKELFTTNITTNPPTELLFG